MATLSQNLIQLPRIFLVSLLQVAIPHLIKVAIDDYIGPGDLNGLNHIALLFAAVLIIGAAVRYAQTYLTIWLGQQVLHDIRHQVFAHLQRLNLAFYDRNPVGRLVTRVTSDVNTLNEMFSSGVVTIIGDLFTLALIVGMLLRNRRRHPHLYSVY